MPAALVEKHREVVLGLGEIRPHRNRSAVRIDCELIQDFGMFSARLDELAIERFRFGEPARLLMPRRGLNHLLRIHGHGRLPPVSRVNIIPRIMPLHYAETIGRQTTNTLAAFGDFFIFCGRTFAWLGVGLSRWKNIRLLLPQMYEVGVRSVPVVAVTGAFIGMVLSVETHTQFKAIGQEERLGSVINLSVVKQIGPVLAAVMLAGRIGGALTAELGTMNVTEQLDALRVMGADPLRVLVVPRFVACVLLTPILTIYSDLLGVIGGWLISVKMLHVPSGPYWQYSAMGVDTWQVMEGVVKSIFFGAAIGLISCYKGFTCGAGASGVGRACTESFVTTFLTIIILNFFFAQLAKEMYLALYGVRSLFG
jgi:phospholipid/cholesterol/gamma-HCH transport system permease protein